MKMSLLPIRAGAAATGGPPRKHRGAFARALWLTGYTLAIVLAVNWLLWRRYVHRLEGHRTRLKLDEWGAKTGFPSGLVRSIGIGPEDARGGLLAAAKTHPGRIRIGALGDSFTFGSEVVGGSDYPGILAAMFAHAGFSNVEVLNFGIGWTGLGQTYRVWESFANQLDLDFVLLGPETLFVDRDETFNHASTTHE